MNNKGFTLVEILAVIVLLAVIITIAVPSITSISRNIKKNMLDAKIELILDDAKIYGQDNMYAISSSAKMYNTYNCEVISVQDLLDTGYLSSDKEDNETGYIVNPTDNSNMNDKNIIIYIKNKRISSIMADANNDGTEENSCS